MQRLCRTSTCHGIPRRSMSVGVDPNHVFARKTKRRQRDWAAGRPDAAEFDYLRQEVARRLVDRLEDIQREFPLALDVGCHAGHVYAALSAHEGLGGRGGIGGVERLVQGDVSEACVRRAVDASAFPGRVETHGLLLDEEFLPFPDATFDLVTSSMALHWVNDLPTALREIKRVLKPDGAFIGAMLGGSTLTELRMSMLIAEQEREGGVSPHVSPMVRVSDVGGLLQGAGFSLPTVDVDTIVAHYSDAFMVMDELHGMGEQNAAEGRRARVGRDTFVAAAAAYHHLAFTDEIEAQKRRMDEGSGDDEATWDGECLSTLPVPATFEVIHMIGWSPHHSQQPAEKRGTATRSLKDISVVTSSPPPPVDGEK